MSYNKMMDTLMATPHRRMVNQVPCHTICMLLVKAMKKRSSKKEFLCCYGKVNASLCYGKEPDQNETKSKTKNFILSPEDMEVTMRAYWAEGSQIHVHTNGDLAMQVFICCC